MAGIQPYRYHESAPTANNMAANQGLTSSASPGSAVTSTLAVSLRSPSNMANPRLLYSTVKMDYYYPRLQIGGVEPVVVTQVLDPHHVFCRLRSLSHEVDSLLESMFYFYEVQKGYADQGPPSTLGLPCACRGVDGRWYRSLLQELFLEQEMAMVIHVDWGRREIVSMSALRNLAAEFFRMPVVTFPCTMYGVTNENFPWRMMLITDLRSSLLGKHVTARIECYNSYEHLYGVTLFAEDGMSFNSLLAIRPKALCAKPIPYMSRYPPKELKVSKFEDAVVEFVIDPSNFWVRLGKFAEDYKKMVNGMTALYSKDPSLMGSLTNLKLGQLYCARHQDLYYRVEVIPTENKPVEVFFLDIGMSMVVDWSNIGELPAEYTKLEALANKCCLADTYPVEETWSEKAILAFKVAVTDKKLIIHVISKDADEYTIEVMDQSRTEDKNVGKILAKEGLARFEELCSVKSHSSGDKIARVESPTAVLSATASDYVPKETTAPSFHEEDMEILDYSPFQEQVYDPGTTIEVLVTHVDNPGKFWCQNARSKSDLLALMAAIQSHCISTNCPYSSSTYACLAKSSLDGKWYRAFITKFPVTISKTSTVEVFYVDYGNHETVPFADLRAINGEFFQLKAQAFRCSLYNIITPRGDNPFLWDGEDTTVFQEFVQKASKWTEFHCIFYATASLDKKQFYIVDLYTPFSGLCDTLVKRGHAKHLHHKALAPCVQLKSYYYSTHDIKCGKEVMIYVTHVDSSSLFYAQLAGNSALDMISSSIKRVVEKTQKTKLSPVSGALCLAKYSDQQWYRGHIQSENGSKKVLFVDFGNTEKVSEEDLLPIMSSEHDILLLPMQAIKFSLSDIPSNVSTEIETWFANTVLEKTLKAEIVSKDANGKSSVQLYDGNLQINAALKSKLGVRVSKDKSNLTVDKPKTFKQGDSRKSPDNASNQERKTLFAVGKNRSKESDTRSCLDISQEAEPHHRKNLGVHYKAENADYKSQSQELGTQRKMETGQRKMESTQNVSSKSSYHGSVGGRDAKQDKNNRPLPQRASTVPAKRQSPAKPPVVTLSDIPNREIFPGMKESVYVSHINSVLDFYVQVAEDRRLDEVSAILNDKTSSFEDLDEDLNVENVICAYFPDDGLYYRGVVTGKTKQGLCVEYIDYGNTSVLLDCKNYRLPQKCCSIPPMSIRCSLIKPKNALMAPNLQDILTEFSNRTQDVQLDCEFLEQDGHKWDVILKDKLGSINDLLAASEEPMLEENLKEVSETLTNLRIVNEEEITIGAFTWNLPQPAATVKVYASAVDGPDRFWCQLSTADIDSLASQVQEAGEQSLKSDNFIAALKIGSPCNVLFSEDNNWYRAFVTRMEADLVTVTFIDYGNEDSVGRDQIRKLPEHLGKVPPQAFLCCLVDFNMKAGTWTSEGKNYFYERIAEVMLDLRVCEIHESVLCHIPVALVSIDYDGLNINEEMRKFWQALPTPDESAGSSPVNVMEADQPCSYKDSSTTDSISSHLSGSAWLEEYTCLGGEDRPLQTDVTEDPYPGEERDSDPDATEAAASPRDARVDVSVEDLDPQDMEDFGSYEEYDDSVDDMPTNTPIPVPIEGGALEPCPLELAACHPFSDLKYSFQQGVSINSSSHRSQWKLLHSAPKMGQVLSYLAAQTFDVGIVATHVLSFEELLTRNTSESLESLILQFSEKLVLLHEEAISDNAAKEEATTESEIIEDIAIEAEVETTEQFGDCTKDGDFDYEEPEVFHRAMETYEQDMDCESDVCDYSEDTFPAETTNTKQQDTGRGGTKQENEGADVCVESEETLQSNTGMEETPFSEVTETSEELKDNGSAPENDALKFCNFASNEYVELKSSINHAQSVTDENKELKDGTPKEVVTGTDIEGNYMEVKDSINRQEPVNRKDLEVEDSGINEEPVDRKDLEVQDSGIHEEPVDCKDLEVEDSGIHEEPVDCKDLEVEDSGIHEEPVDCKDLEVKDSEINEETVDRKDLEVEDSGIHEEPVDCKDLEVEDSGIHEEPDDCKDLEVEDSEINEETVDRKDLEVEDSEINEETVDRKDLEVEDSGIHEEPDDCKDLEVEDSEINKETVDRKDLEVEDSEINEETVDCKDLEVEDSGINEETVDRKDLEVEHSGIHEEPVDPKDLEVEHSGIHEEPVDPKDLEVEHSGIHEEPVDPKDLEVEHSGIHEEPVDPKDLVVEESGINEEPVDRKDLEVEDSGINEEPVDRKDLEVKDSGINEEPVDLKDLVVEESGISEEPVDRKELEVEESGINEEPVDRKELEVEESGINEEPVDLKDLVVEESGISEEPVDRKELEVEESGINEEPVDRKELEVEESGINEEPVDRKELEVEHSGIHEEPVDRKELEVEHSGIHEEPVDCKELDVEHSGIHEEPVNRKDLGLEDSMNREYVIAKEERELKDNMNGNEAVAKEKVLEEYMNCKEGNEENAKNCIKYEEAVTCEDVKSEDAAAYEGKAFCKYFSTDLDYEEPEILQEFVETVKSEIDVVERLITMTSKVFVQTEEDLLSCNIIDRARGTIADFEEVIKAEEQAVIPEEASEEASISFEMLESTIVEGPLTDLSQDFVASENLEQKDSESPEEGVADDVQLKDCINEEDLEAKDLETEAATFKEVSRESLSTDDVIDHVEPEVFQRVMETCEQDVDCERDVCDHSEDSFPTENINAKQQDTGRERAVTEVLDAWEPIAEDMTSKRDGTQQESFTVYRECPKLIASTDSELNELPEVTDSDCEGTGGSTNDLHCSYSFGSESTIQATVESEDADERSDCTLQENVSQADDCDTEAADLADRGGRAPESDVSSSAEAELSPPACHGGKSLS